MDSAFPPNLYQILAAIEEAEVITIYCPHVGKTLIVDTRSSSSEGPYVALVPMVGSLQERLASFDRLRPRFPRPDQLFGIPWQRRLAGLRELGIVHRLGERLLICGLPDAPIVVDHLFQQLHEAEERELKAAVGGDGYRALWERES